MKVKRSFCCTKAVPVSRSRKANYTLMRERIVQTEPITRNAIVKNDDASIIKPHYKGVIYNIRFALWKVVDRRFEKRPRTYSLAGLRNTYTGEVIYKREPIQFGASERTYNLHRLSDASDIYNLCFRKYVNHMEEVRFDPLHSLQVRVRSRLEKKIQRIYHDRRLEYWRGDLKRRCAILDKNGLRHKPIK